MPASTTLKKSDLYSSRWASCDELRGGMDASQYKDLHRIVDTFTRQAEVPRFSRMVPFAEIADPKNDYNLNLPRYLDTTEPEDLQDIDAHLRGGIPNRDLDALDAYWRIIPGVRAALFKQAARPGYSQLKLPLAEVKPEILGHAEFIAFNDSVSRLFARWKKAARPHLLGFARDGHPKALIETIAEDLLATFRAMPLLDAYDVYQHLMDYWAVTMQDDCYLIAAEGWKQGALPREIRQVKNKEGKLVWPEKEDFKKGKRRFKSDLVPAALRERPVLTLNHLTRRQALSFPVASKAMLALVDLGIARELTGQRRNRVFAYDGYLKLLNEGGQPL